MDRERGRVLRKKRELAYEGTVLKVYRDPVVTDGREESWDFIHHNGVATVVPMLPDEGTLMVRQYRDALDHFTLELPVGRVDSPKEPRVLYAFCELSEETDMRVESPGVLGFLLRVDTTITFCDEEIDIFIAQSLLSGEQHLDPDEAIDVQTYELLELPVRIERDEIRDTETVAGLTAYAPKQSRSNRT